MIIATFNIRGLGSRVKRRKIRELISVNNLDFLALQETKLLEVTDPLCYSLWGNADYDWVSLPAVGNSGGDFINLEKIFCLSCLFNSG
jgi:exonuclease III